MTSRRPFRLVPVILLAVAAISLPSSPAAEGGFIANPRLASDTTGLWAGFQATLVSDGIPQYEIRRLDERDKVWYDRGRFNGTLAGLASGGGKLWVATSDGALVVLADGADETVVFPDNRRNLLDLAWFDGRPAALDHRDGRLGLVFPTAGGSWSEPESIAAAAAGIGKAVLTPVDDALHLFWREDNADLSGGTVRHMIRERGRWREEETLPLGGVGTFAAFVDAGTPRVIARLQDVLGRSRPPRLIGLAWENGAWNRMEAAPEPVQPRLAGVRDFTAVSARGQAVWLLASSAGAIAVRLTEKGSFDESPLAPGLDERMAWPTGIAILSAILVALLLAHACRKSRLVSLANPGRPADMASRAVAVFIDGFIASLGIASYHLAAGDINIYEEFLDASMMNKAFWINMTGLVFLTGASEAAYGATPGKWLMGIRVRSATGGPAGFLQIAGRSVFRIIDMFPVLFPGLVGALVSFSNKRRQRLGDIVGGTVVLRHAPIPRRKVVLASSSPRRRELVEALGLSFRCAPPHIDEGRVKGETPAETVRLLAEAKAKVAFGQGVLGDELVIAADTMVVVDGEILGKPADADDARRMLNMLSGRSHSVVSGVAVWDAATGQILSDAEETEVEFRSLSGDEIDRYVASGDCMDKAGAYGIQSARLVKQIRGSLSNVAGLPMETLRDLLRFLDA